jgi:hypothetical protein
MRKIFTLIVLFVFAQQFVKAQTVIRDETVNFAQLAAYEAAHPELFKPCPTCPRREADGGWEEFATPNLTVPPGANIKMAPPIPKRDENNPVPMVPSRAPVQNWLGHVDPGSIIPPDTYGAVGLDRVVTATNDFIRIHNKVGGAQISNVSISGFTGVPSTCDPQMFFDPNTQRWIFCAIGCAGSSNPVIVMVSNTSDPSGTWRNFQFVPLPGGLLDHPYLGYDDTKIVIGGRKFTPSFTGPEIYLIDKAAFLAGTPITFGVNAQTITRTAADGDSPRPVTVYFPPFSNSGNPSPGTVYIMQSWTSSSLRLSTISGAIPAAVWNTASAVFPTAPDSWTAGGMGNPGSVQQQPPETRRLQANDARVSSAVMMNGKIWLAHHIAFPAGATATAVTHTEVQYWQLEGNPGGTFGNVLQRGRTGAIAGQHRWFSSIAVNKNEDVLVGYSASDATTMWPSSAYSTRQLATAPNTLDDPRVYHAGEGRYWKDFGSGRARWGDYSQTHLDPVDNSLWTIQQYASTPAGAIPPDNNSRYGVWWAQVPPSVVVPTPVISANGSTLVAESCAPANLVIDPGETVTVSFCLQNTGTAATVNAVGTLQATGGVIPITTSQNYGVIPIGGTVCRDFQFTNNSTTCGATITASIQVQDGAANLGTVTYNYTLGNIVTSITENFDGVVAPALPAGWVATNLIGAAPLWVTSNSGTPTPVNVSAPNAAFINDPSTVSDKVLTTPAFTPGAGARVTFSKNYILETGFDGGVLEISINGGAYQDIIAAGGSFVTGGYTGTISTSFGNPIGGRQAWTGSSGGFNTTTANLPLASAGQSVRLRFRMGSDNSVAGTGWRIDNYSLSEPQCCGVTCTLTCPANMTVGSSGGQCGANVSFAASASGLCGPIFYSPASGSFFPVGTTTVNVSTASGATCSFTVTVTDNTPPTIVCPANMTVNNTPNLCGANVTYPLPTVSDNCPLTGGTPVVLNQSSNTTLITPIQIGCQYAGGITAENSWWRAYNLAPLNLPAGIAIKSVRFGIEKITGGPVPITARIYRMTSGTFPTGTRTLLGSQTQTFAAQVGTFQLINFTSAIAANPTDVIVVELYCPDQLATGRGFFIGSNAAPETGPSYISAVACGIANPTDLADIGFPDDNIHLAINGEYYVSPPTLVQIAGIPSGGFHPVGVTTNTYRATDAAGNTAQCSFTVTVVDAQAPSLTCPPNMVRPTDAGVCYATVVTPNPTFSDNCAVTQLTWTITGATTASSPATGINFVGTRQFNLNGRTGQGVSTVTYSARDAAGNVTNCSFTVTVNDALIPVITTQPATRFFCVGSNAVFSVTATAAGGPLTYQWQEWNGSAWVNIAGATASSYTIPNITFADNTRSFRVALTGLCSDVISQFATLYVNPLPTISLTTSIPPSLLPGQSLTITAVVNPPGGTFQWFKNGVLTSHTGSSWSGLTVDDIGTYRVVYTDPNGCVRASSDLVVSGQPSDNMWVYPNPNNGQFQVRFFNQDNETATVRVFDSKGAKVFETEAVLLTAYYAVEVDLGPTISDGVYIVVANNSAGKKMGARRIIVRRKP